MSDTAIIKPTRARNQITRALADKGWAPHEIEWEPVGFLLEMAGPEGGWSITAFPADEDITDDVFIHGYNVGEVLERIAEIRDYSGATV